MVSEKCPLSLQILRSEGSCPPRVTGHTARLDPGSTQTWLSTVAPEPSPG